jgi:glycosyltransferase involved in cell wall biosynthesis
MEDSAHPPLHIVHVDSEKGFSGGEVQVFLLIEGLRQRGWHNVLVCQPDSRCADEAGTRGIETRLVPMRSDLDVCGLFRLTRLLGRLQTDLVHLHTGRATWLGGIAARLAGLPAITTRRMDRPVRRGWRTRWIYRTLVQHAAAISPAVAQRLADAGVGARVTVVRSAVDPLALTPIDSREATRAKLGAAADRPVLLVSAALVRRKGVDVLLQALAVLGERGIRPLLWIAGDGAERHALEAQAVEAGLAAQVRFLGRRSDVADLLAACDVFVLPSRREGLGVAALEAMAAGRPVVASAVGGLQDVVVDGRTGLLVRPEDAAALAEAIARLMQDEELRRRLGSAGPQRVREGFLAEQMVSSYVELYEKVLDKWRANARV